jgi:hypothetical protein
MTERVGSPAVRHATTAPAVETSPVATPPEPSPPAPADEPALEARGSEELAWATARFPEIADYVSEQRIEATTAELLSWAEPGDSVTVFDRACQPAVVTRHDDDQFWGNLTRKVIRSGGTIRESYDQISIGFRLNEFGCNHVEYERNAAGQWAVVASQGFGCWDIIGRALSQVKDDAAWYDAAMVRLSIDCSRKVVEETACANGKTKACERCEEWKVRAHPLESNFGISRHPSVRRVTLPPSNDCGSPCAVETPPPDVQRANEALRGREFLYIIEYNEHPLVFRTKAACQGYRKIHRFSADELDFWRSGIPRPRDLPRPGFPDE